ncbi:cyclic peptide export ABC transporter [Nostoc sp. FACHB-892]|uniref:cyclic peptide export ABC transporter n=1 Tax=Nostoc sp. FACHB-892 TaxID=2692843 RepID=UPI001688861E|nr:cyclic peptide export ABC transporter [Nostoc sp. FACHB-892]MBD2730148.1 cyclic peptide export ABC transporter [Nostoc sp. FACHB-892]
MKLVHLLIKTSWVKVIFATLCGLTSGITNVGLITIINLMLREGQLQKSNLFWYFVLLCCLQVISSTVTQVLIARLAQGVTFNLQQHFVFCIITCPLKQIENIGIPCLLTALTEDIQSISAASLALSDLSISVAILTTCLFYLSWLSSTLFCLMFIFMLIGIFYQQILIIKGIYFLKRTREYQDKLFYHFRTATEGIKELKLHCVRQEEFLNYDLHITTKNLSNYRERASNFFSVAAGSGLLLFFIPIGLLFFFIAPLFDIPSTVVSGYVITIFFMMSPFRVLLVSLPVLSQANIALAKVESLGLLLAVNQTKKILKLSPDNQLCDIPQKNWKSIQLEEVTHTYRGEGEDSKFMLGPLNLNFYSGELVFIAGGNGSGKSTLVKLITGLYIPENGIIRFNEQDINDENREWYSQQFSVVFSDFYLFERFLGLDNFIINNKAQEYLSQLQLEHKVTIKDGVLSTTALSQGQRKRLALLTAYLEERPIYIFDEWASDQDPIFKKIFYTQLLPDLKSKGKTVIVISHDDQYFSCADRIIKLDYGKVIFSE